MGSSAARKDYRPLINELIAQGWTIDETAQGHWKAVPPDRTKPLVHFAMSDDPRGLRNTVRDLKRAGFVWPPLDHEPLSTIVDGVPMGDDLDAEIAREVLLEAEGQSQLVPQPIESAEQRMDRLFHALKEAKTYLQLADETLAACSETLRRAQDAFDAASSERTSAAAKLEEIKAQFLEAVAA